MSSTQTLFFSLFLLRLRSALPVLLLVVAGQAVCCYFPFAVVELVVLAAVDVPTTLCRRALRAGARCRRASRAAMAKKKEMAGMDRVSKGELQQPTAELPRAH